MLEVTSAIEKNFNVLVASALAWILFVIAVSIAYRRMKGKPVYPRRLPRSVFSESWASGNSNRNALTKLGGARNCLLVSVNNELVQVTPRFPFNLMFLPEIYGLEYQIPKNRILSAVIERRWLMKMIELRFLDSSGKEQSISLKLRNPERFLDLVRQDA